MFRTSALLCPAPSRLTDQFDGIYYFGRADAVTPLR